MTYKLSDKIASIMVDQGITQSELARIAEVKHSAINYWRAGTNIPRAEPLLKIAKHFGYDFESLANENQPLRLTSEPFLPTPKKSEKFYILEDSTMEPGFPSGTKIYVNDELKPRTGDYVIVESPLFSAPVFREYIETMGKCYLKSIANFPTVEISSDMVIMGVAVKAEIDLKK